VPAAVAPLVQGVLGLDDLYLEEPLDTGPLGAAPTAPVASRVRASAAGTARQTRDVGPQPCGAAPVAYTANIIAGIYGLKLLSLVKDLGKGIRIGVRELEPNLKSDITAYEKCYKISTKVNYIKVDGGAGSGAGSGEAALDIEMVAGLAPKSTIDIYQAPNSGGGGPGHGFYDDFKKFVTSDVDKVLSVSAAPASLITASA